MTPEQKQLELIRGRVYVLKTATLHGPVPLQTTMDLVTDIDFLLSLVKSQEAEDVALEAATQIHKQYNNYIPRVFIKELAAIIQAVIEGKRQWV